jgi:excisionase family DNA binding protein
LLTVEEAASALHIGRAKVYRLIMERQLFSVKVGGSRRVPVKALEAYVEQLVAEQQPSHAAFMKENVG